MSMTPLQKVKWAILKRFVDGGGELYDADDNEVSVQDVTAENVDELFDVARDDEDCSTTISDLVNYKFREGEEETGLPCPSSRHYEAKSVAAQMPDGSWVGWTYWYGGGKHGEPEAIDWMEDVYEVECREEQRVVRVFSLKEDPASPGVCDPQ